MLVPPADAERELSPAAAMPCPGSAAVTESFDVSPRRSVVCHRLTSSGENARPVTFLSATGLPARSVVVAIDEASARPSPLVSNTGTDSPLVSKA